MFWVPLIMLGAAGANNYGGVMSSGLHEEEMKVDATGPEVKSVNLGLIFPRRSLGALVFFYLIPSIVRLFGQFISFGKKIVGGINPLRNFTSFSRVAFPGWA